MDRVRHDAGFGGKIHDLVSTKERHLKMETTELSPKELSVQLDISRCEAYFWEVVLFAEKTKQLEDLRQNLIRLINIGNNCKTGKPVLYKDFAPYSFGFNAGGMIGGLIFHGVHDRGGDGGAPTYSVNLTPVDGWSIHT
jgi:hypothetical protein